LFLILGGGGGAVVIDAIAVAGDTCCTLSMMATEKAVKYVRKLLKLK
jgi:hypothetical protein